MEKRGQVTVFIILGIVIVAVVGIFLAFRSGLVDTYLNSERDRVKVPNEIEPVQEYLEFCLEDAVREGIGYMGLQGGYLELDTYKASYADKFTNVLTVYPGYKVAYWYYEDLNGVGKNQMPTIGLMEEQLNFFVGERFKECLNDLDEFESEGFEIDVKNTINPDIRIEDDFIDTVVRVPVNIKKGGVSAKISRHVIDVDSSFGSLYEKAKTIFEDENEKHWLENTTLSYLYYYTEDLPHYDVEFTCKSLLWKESEIADNYREILELNIPFYMIAGSDFNNYYAGEPSLTWNVNGDFSDNSVYFSYDRKWPFELDIQGSQGDAVISQPFPGGIPMIGFCVNNYNFIYDIKHPVMISVSDELGEEEFSFATQVVIRENKPRKEVEVDDSINYCTIRDTRIEVDVASTDESGYYDSLEGASIFYNCMNNMCYLGDSDESGRYVGAAPICFGGELEIIKEGYKTTSVSHDTFGGGRYVSVGVEELIPLDYSVMVYDLVNGNLIGPRELNSDERVVLQVQDINDNFYSHMGFYPDEDQTIELSPGSYQLTAKLLNNGPAVIEEKEIERCKCPEVPLAGCLCGSEEITLEAFEIEDVVTGGSELLFLVERGDLSRDNVVFYVVNKGMPNTYDDLMETYDSALLSLGRGEYLKPSFENE